MDEKYRNAIGTVESSNNYSALGPETSSGDRAYGRYQVMGDNIPDWTERHLGQRMTPQEFLANKEAQDKVFDGETSAQFKKYGNLDDVTSTWFSGRPVSRAGNSSDGYNTVPQYLAKVNKAYGTDGPTAIDQAMGRTGSPRMAYADENTPPALYPQQPQGALSAGGSPVAQQPAWIEALRSIGHTMTEMAPGIAQDPDNKNALQKVAEAGRKQQGTWSTHQLPNGQVGYSNSLRPGMYDASGRAMTGNYAKDDKWAVVGKDKYGQPVYGYPPSPEEYKASKSAASAEPNPSADLTGKDYLTALQGSDPTHAAKVQAIIDGRMPFPVGRLRTTPEGSRLADDVVQADPSFETGNAMSRVKVRNEFKAGGVSSPAGQITAGNTALQHAGEMSDAIEELKGGGKDYSGIPFLSYYQNKGHNAAIQGTPEGAAYGKFTTARDHFAEEVTKFYSGSTGSEAERKRALDNLDAAKSLPELRAVIKQESGLVQGKVNALQERWKTGMGPLAEDFPLIHPESQKAIDRIHRRASESETGAKPSAAPGGKRPALGDIFK